MKITGDKFADCAALATWDRFTYSHMDCQGFVEAVLKECGVRKPDGTVYNWRGSNSMFRNYVLWHGTIEECILKFGQLPRGAFVYMWQENGAPEGYNDGYGNFKHVGIYIGDNKVRDSTRVKNGRDGVGTRTLKGFTHCSLFSGLDYESTEQYTNKEETALIDQMIDMLKKLRGMVGG